MKITKQFTFHAAHQIKGHPVCGRLHGHTYKVEVTLAGTFNEMDSEFGYLKDFSYIKRIFKEKVFKIVDHNYLNDIEGLKYTSAEELAAWIFEKLMFSLKPSLCEIIVWETPTSSATVTSDDIMEYQKWKKK